MAKMRGKKTQLQDTFFLSFIGEFVEISGNFNFSQKEIVVSVSGYILDIDDEYYYIGNTPEHVTSALKKAAVVYIQIINEKEMFSNILNDLKIPNEEEKKN